MRRILKAAAWAKAPRLMFAKRHPRKAALLAATGWLARKLGRRQKTSFTRTAAQGIGAAAVAIPLGLWVGRKVRGGSGTAENAA
jgi:hypothetical protein